MDKHAHQFEHPAATGSQHATSSITFDSVINLNDYARKNCKININQSVVERPGQGKGGGEFVSANENVRMTENGKLVAEHVLNDLTLTEQGRNLHLSDHTYVNAAGQKILEGKKEGHASGSDDAKRETGKDRYNEGEAVLPKFGITDHAKRETGKDRYMEGEDLLPKLGISDHSKS
jgi:hypothetical protein